MYVLTIKFIINDLRKLSSLYNGVGRRKGWEDSIINIYKQVLLEEVNNSKYLEFK